MHVQSAFFLDNIPRLTCPPVAQVRLGCLSRSCMVGLGDIPMAPNTLGTASAKLSSSRIHGDLRASRPILRLFHRLYVDHYTSWIIRSIVTSVFVPITPACGKTLPHLDLAKSPGIQAQLLAHQSCYKIVCEGLANKPSVANILLSFESMANP